MAKKGFTTAPRPKGIASNAIDKFVEGGHGRDVERTETQKNGKMGQDIPMARLTVDMPRDLHRRFKAACASKDRKMNDEIRSFIERRLIELEE